MIFNLLCIHVHYELIQSKTKVCLRICICFSPYIANTLTCLCSYIQFLLQICIHSESRQLQIGKDPIILQGLKELVIKDAFTNLGGIEKWYKTVGVHLKLDPKMKIPCSVSKNDISILLYYVVQHDCITFTC